MDESRAQLHDLPILKFLPADVRELVVDSFVPESFSFGSPIVREGEEAEAFYGDLVWSKNSRGLVSSDLSSNTTG